MSLLQDYSITCDKKGNYILNFTTTTSASASYKFDGTTNFITLNEDSKGDTSFSNNYGNANKNFKFEFDQPDPAGRRRKPSGSIDG